MLLSLLCQLPLGLLLASLTDASTLRYHRLTKRDPSENVLDGANFPDPSIINVDGTSYAFSTTSAGLGIPMVSNPDFSDASGWSAITDAFPSTDVPAFGDGGWAVPTTSWAPDVNQLTDYDSSFAMYYAPETQANNNIHCVGLARSLTVGGPYNDSSTYSFICPSDAGGAIDPAGFLDTDNSRYVVYKIDGPAANSGGYCAGVQLTSQNTSLMLQQVDNDGYTLIGSPVVLYDNAGESDGFNIEAPSLVRSSDGIYFLFFSSGCYSDNSYAESYVTATSVSGPYGNRQLLLQTGDYGLYAPGGLDIDGATGDVVFHSDSVSANSGTRWLNTDTVTLGGLNASVNKR